MPDHRNRYQSAHGRSRLDAQLPSRPRMTSSKTRPQTERVRHTCEQMSESLHGTASSRATLRRRISGRTCERTSPSRSHRGEIRHSGRRLHVQGTRTRQAHRKRAPTTSLLALPRHPSIARSVSRGLRLSIRHTSTPLDPRAVRAPRCTGCPRQGFHLDCASHLLGLDPLREAMPLDQLRHWRGPQLSIPLPLARHPSQTQTGMPHTRLSVTATGRGRLHDLADMRRYKYHSLA